MKIGMVCYPTYGGSGVIATELGKALAHNNHHVHFITSSQPVRLNLFDQNIFFHEVAVNDYPLFKYQPYEIALTSKIVDVAKHEKLDVLHVHYAIPHASAAYLAKQILKDQGIDLPIITTLHGTDITLVGKDPSFEPVITFSINNSDAVTTVSESLRKDTYKHFGVQRDIHVVPNFVCNQKYKKEIEECHKKIFAPNDEKIIMHISNFRKVKRIQDAIKAFALIQKEVPSKLILVGDGPERFQMENLARSLKVEHLVHFVGKIKDIEGALCAADLFLMPSEQESFGLAALEAMAAGVPVISTNAGGLPEVNFHGETGYLTEVGDFEAMAKFAIQMFKDTKITKQLKDNALIQAQKFDIHNILPDYLSVYESVLLKEKV
jgi:N-acetyl-alpha-D-glucosaminyl L-malate synthase BshA